MMKKKKVVVLYTFPQAMDEFKNLFAQYVPEVEMINIADDSLLQEALANQGVTAAARERYLQYALIAERLGADAILNQCSSYTECADWAEQALHIPILKIDAPMAEQANRLGQKIAVIVTAISSVGPSSRLVARYGGPDTQVTPCYVDGAYQALLQGNRDQHDDLVIAAVEKAAANHEVIVMAQGSMARLL
ncbi:MAG: Asp/Glu/hydantoin racemase, partial [Clostridia bacterium]|nr:Asp/Glu/hydantoin racemase [Clostridia bacterium]